MTSNSESCLLVLILSSVFMAPCRCAECYSGQGTPTNVTCKDHQNSTASQQCIMLMNSTLREWIPSCDDKQLCSGKQNNAYHHVCNEEGRTSFYCCIGHLCNNRQQSVETFDFNFTCSSNSSKPHCSYDYCIETTYLTSDGTFLNSSVDCYHHISRKSCNTTSSQNQIKLHDGSIERSLLFNCSEICESRAPSAPPASSPGMPRSATEPPKTRGLSAGVVVGAVVVMVAGLVLIAIGVKKCYERHINKRLEYSYAQLTIDMLDDEDDHLILP